jgi:trehalose 6-phosphate phosphatase
VDSWTWTFDHASPQDEATREALCTLGNGYMATRGAAPEATADGSHYPGTYAAGCYNRLVDVIDGVRVENESMVNLPNWLSLTMRAEDGPWLGSTGATVVNERYDLDVRRGVLMRWFTWHDGFGRRTQVVQERFVHMRRPHVCGLRTRITAVNWSGTLTLRSGVDGRVRNDGVARYRGLSKEHLEVLSAQPTGVQGVICTARTVQSQIRIALAVRTGLPDSDVTDVVQEPGYVAEELVLPLTPGNEATVDKLATIVTSKTPAISEPALAAIHELRSLSGFDELLAEHETDWEQLWRRFHLAMPARAAPALATIRLDLFHVLQTVSLHNAELDAGVPARGLHGEAYRGHVLWDELFVLPMLNLHHPSLSRAMLRYRYRRLPSACEAAEAAGLPGAMYPWQSGSDGREENQRVHLNPSSGRWTPDETDRQRHVGLAIAYDVWQYCQATADWRFLDDYGAEIILQVARYFAAIAEFDPARQRYLIRGVMGPDEFHTRYPGRPVGGIDNNAYTNVMVAWLLPRAIESLSRVSPPRRVELEALLGLVPHELARWDEISRRMFVPFHRDGVISQFEGYESLSEFDWDGYRSRYPDIGRLDRILEAEGDDVNRYRVSKQADALMLFYLLSADELREVLGRCGYALDPDVIPRTVEFYRARTSHGSTLSSVVHAWVLARGRRTDAVRYFVGALRSDVSNVHGGTTGEGIHLAAMAGTVDLLQRCFGGVEIRGDTLYLNPYWPSELGSLEFDIQYRDHTLRITITAQAVRIECTLGDRLPITVRCGDRTAVLAMGDVVEFAEERAARSGR